MNRIQEIINSIYIDFGDEIPINPAKICEGYNIKLFYAEMEDPTIDAFSKYEDGEYKILINKFNSKTRQRFSIAHELGHILLHFEIYQNKNPIAFRNQLSQKGINKYEIEANEFAANLLMNEDEVRCLWDIYSSPALLAAKFDVSQDAMNYRLKNLGLIK